MLLTARFRPRVNKGGEKDPFPLERTKLVVFRVICTVTLKVSNLKIWVSVLDGVTGVSPQRPEVDLPVVGGTFFSLVDVRLLKVLFRKVVDNSMDKDTIVLSLLPRAEIKATILIREDSAIRPLNSGISVEATMLQTVTFVRIGISMPDDEEERFDGLRIA